MATRRFKLIDVPRDVFSTLDLAVDFYTRNRLNAFEFVKNDKPFIKVKLDGQSFNLYAKYLEEIK